MKSKRLQGASHKGRARKVFTSNPPLGSPRMIYVCDPAHARSGKGFKPGVILAFTP
jgi:hypothetical protein